MCGEKQNINGESEFERELKQVSVAIKLLNSRTDAILSIKTSETILIGKRCINILIIVPLRVALKLNSIHITRDFFSCTRS